MATLFTSTPDDAERHGLAWIVLPADLATPVQAFLSLRAAGRRAALLESAAGPDRLARYSFVALDPRASFRAGSGSSQLTTGTLGGPRATREFEGPAHAALTEVLADERSFEPAPLLPPFTGGWIGWFAYEFATELEPRIPLAENDPFGLPLATFDRYTRVVAFDHGSGRLFLIAECNTGRAGHGTALNELERIRTELDTRPADTPFSTLESEPRPLTSKAQFIEGVEQLGRAIAAGEVFQAVLSQRFEQRFEGDPFALYRALRICNPAPHMFFFEADGLCLCGSSPERLVAVDGRRAELVPIAGTRPRGADAAEDQRLARDLETDIKERAEHDMLVDLARNDLGRVASLGSVAVDDYARVERFARVQHLVSRVTCDLTRGKSGLDALAACFPAGTVSGAPKIRAQELLAELETDRRGPYAGGFGYIDARGGLDLCITIRTIATLNGVIHVQSGAGIVHDSVAESEFLETRHKARALFEAVELAATGVFDGGAIAASAKHEGGAE